MGAWRDFIQTLLDRGARAAETEGATRIARFGDLEAEYRALAAGPAVVDRSDRGLLEVTGADRLKWLHQLTTNQVKSLSPGEGNYAFVLNVRGRILFDLNMLVRGDCVWIDLHRECVEPSRIHFEKYRITEDVSVADRSDDFVRIGLTGRGAAGLLSEMGASHAANMPLLGTSQVTWSGVALSLVRTDFCGPLSVEFFVPAGHAAAFWRTLVTPSRAVPVGDDAVQVHRIEAGILWPGHEITDDVLPAETGQLERAVNLTKGCYIGQEVVERMRSRDALARRLVGLEVAGDTMPPAGAKIQDGSRRPIGQVTSVCRSIARGCIVALGYVKGSSGAAPAPLRLAWAGGEAQALIVELPFVSLSHG